MITATEIIARANAEAVKIDAAAERWMVALASALHDEIVAHWSTPLPRAPGIYWTRTGGKTHTVEVVR